MLLRVYVNTAATSLMRDKSSSYCIEAVLTQDQVNTSTALSQSSSILSSCCHLVQNLLVSRCWCVSSQNPEPGQEKLT